MTSGFAVDSGILLGGLLLAAGVVGAVLTGRYRLPGLVLFLGLGMLVGDDGLAWVRFDDAVLAQNVAVVALAVILFEGGLSTDFRTVREVLVPAIGLATVGVAVTGAVVAVVSWWLLGTSIETALILGAVIASTDAAAVFDVLRRSPLPNRLRHLLQLESGGNDPMAVLLTVGITVAVMEGATPGDWARFGALQVALGLAGGWLVGLVARRALRMLPADSASTLDIVALAAGAVSYGLTAVAGGSGFLAVYVTGMTIAGERRLLRSMRSFHEGLASTAQAGLFIMLGLLVFPSRLTADIPEALVVTVVLVLLARPLAVLVCLLPFRFQAREVVVVSWAGLRGAVPIVLATVPLAAGYAEGQFIFDVVFVVVAVSLLVQAPTVGLLASGLGLRADAVAPATLDISALESLDADVVEVHLHDGSPVVERHLRDCPPPGGARIAYLLRDDDHLVPSGGTRLRAGDRLLLIVPPASDPAALDAWASAGSPPAEGGGGEQRGDGGPGGQHHP